ncbi:DUF4124 domain-containing protein [Montanilutibacter psychrotolerans]|uniref:DUF4124 domain-containing protein n=1 Tax=Montanilutibacter psychrotolerans TaxID=1327343 RepID=A0A3M8SWT6_9GAMM|nr:DUF4124 domain-containing protein [Lysobacter psychrotolerans]
MIRLAAVLVLLAPGVAGAQQVYKCVGGGGAISYQSEPCAASQRAVKAWDATPEAPPSNEELWRRHRAQRRAAAESAYLSRLAGTDRLRSPSVASGAIVRVERDSSQCDYWRQERQRQLYDNPNAQVSAQHRSWLHMKVAEACK